MDRLAHDVVDAGVEERQGRFERGRVADGDDRSLRAFPDGAWQAQRKFALADQERLDRVDVGLRRGVHPFAEFFRIEPRRWDPLPSEQRCISPRHELSLVHYDDHSPRPPNQSVAS